MSRLDVPTREQVPAESHEALDQIQKTFRAGTVSLGRARRSCTWPLRRTTDATTAGPRTLVGAKIIRDSMHDAVDVPIDFPAAPALEAAHR